MKTLLETCGTQTDIDPRLEQLFESISNRMQAGESVDLEGLVAEHPEFAEALRELVPAVAALVKLGEESREPKPVEEAAEPSKLPWMHQQLGDFHLIREIGRGGMGTVYEAEQLSMGRRVALKVLPFAALAHDKSLQRFRNEVRAAAALDHLHIVSVYSVGEDRGVHYYAMQLIRGQTLAELITDIQMSWPADSQPGSNRLNDATTQVGQARIRTVVDSRQAAERFRCVARLGIQAAEALQHAHDQGVLHRDIKPSNLMLDAEGQLYVTDFGLARIESDAGMTMTGDLIGTLRYMAPEQALVERVVIDHRADIYSLGATLYELLTLQPAFGETDRSELLKQIAFEEPVCPRKLDHQIPAKLETIVLKAIAKIPEERYQSAHELAEDLQAFLEFRPIEAKPRTLADRLTKWSRRYSRLIGVTGIVLFVCAGVLATANFQISKAYRNALNQERAAQEVSGFLQNMLTAADPANVDGQELTVREMLDKVATELEGQFEDQPEVEAILRATVARSYNGLRLLQRAIPQYQRALELYERSDSTSTAMADLLISYAYAQRTTGKHEEAARDVKRALEILKHNDESPEHLIGALSSQFVFLNESGLTEEASAVAEEAFQLADDSNCGSCDGLASILASVALVKAKDGEIAEAELLARQSVEMQRQLDGNDQALGWRLSGLGRVLGYANKLEDSVVAQREALAEFRGYSPDHMAILVVKIRLAYALCRTGDFFEAERLRDEVIAGCRENLRFGTSDAGGLESIATYFACSEFPQLRSGIDAVNAATKACELSNYKSANMLSVLAAAYAETGDFERALECAKKSVRLDLDNVRFARRLALIRLGRPWRLDHERHGW